MFRPSGVILSLFFLSSNALANVVNHKLSCKWLSPEKVDLGWLAGPGDVSFDEPSADNEVRLNAEIQYVDKTKSQIIISLADSTSPDFASSSRIFILPMRLTSNSIQLKAANGRMYSASCNGLRTEDN